MPALAQQLIGCAAPIVDARLRERGFGTLEGGSDACYAEIWAHDALDASSAPHGVESAQAVRTRVLELLCELERQPAGPTILLVAHGDTIQILWTVFAGLGAGEHRRRAALRPGQLGGSWARHARATLSTGEPARYSVRHRQARGHFGRLFQTMRRSA